MPRCILITGCSGGGKSTLLAALAAAGHRVVEEPGRRIVREQQASGGQALPWVDPVAFARRALGVAMADLDAVRREGPRDDTAPWRPDPVFFDRGIIDAAVALEHAAGIPLSETLEGINLYDRRVFVAPPWPKIHRTESERPHGLTDAVAEYHRLVSALARLGFEQIELPRLPVQDRVGFVLSALHLPAA